MKWNIGTKIGSGYALALAALMIIGVVAYRSTSGLIDTASMVTHTHQVLENLEQLISLLKDAETGQRGFLITGEDRYLEPYNAATGQIAQTTKEIRDLTADNPNQQQRLDTLDPLITDKLAELQETIDLRKDPTKGFEAAKDVVVTDKGKNLMDNIRKVVGDMEGEEHDLLKKRADEAAVSADQTHSRSFGALSRLL